MARLYLDLNCFNRPFDDQSQERIARETRAVLSILQRIVDQDEEMVWSAVLEFENSRHPRADRRTEIARWARQAVEYVGMSELLAERAQQLAEAGFGSMDATHLASAQAAGLRFLPHLR